MAKNPWIAAILSLLVAGLGQAYVGRYLKAGLFFAVEFATGILYVEYNVEFAAAVNVAVGLLSVWDAYRDAKAGSGQRIFNVAPNSPKGPQLRAY